MVEYYSRRFLVSRINTAGLNWNNVAYSQCHIYWSRPIDQSNPVVGSASLVAPSEAVEPLPYFCHLCPCNAVLSFSVRLPGPTASQTYLPLRIPSCVLVVDASPWLGDRQRCRELGAAPLGSFGRDFARGPVHLIAMGGVSE